VDKRTGDDSVSKSRESNPGTFEKGGLYGLRSDIGRTYKIGSPRLAHDGLRHFANASFRFATIANASFCSEMPRQHASSFLNYDGKTANNLLLFFRLEALDNSPHSSIIAVLLSETAVTLTALETIF